MLLYNKEDTCNVIGLSNFIYLHFINNLFFTDLCTNYQKLKKKEYVFKVVYFIRNIFSRRSLAQHSRIFFGLDPLINDRNF